MSRLRLCCVLLIPLLLGASGRARPEAFVDPAKAGADFGVQGEYVGQVETPQGKATFGVQVIGLGEGRFHMVAYRGGLPGAGWDKSDTLEADAARADDVVRFAPEGHQVKAVWKAGVVSVETGDGKTIGTLKKTLRQSPTLGAKPPKEAVVLFDGTTVDPWKEGRKTDDGLLKEGAVSRQRFGSATIHLEFRAPFTPAGRGQARGNSGCYVQGRYEIQILDSFGLKGQDNECGGIYKVSRPAVNMCLPPLAWQTYDIDFTAAAYSDGKKVRNARITVRHNGVVIHDDVELPGSTPGGVSPEGPDAGPLFLQNHGDPVRFRNIWVAPKPEKP